MSTAIEPSRAVAEMLRHRRLELGLSLRQVEERTRQLGKPIHFTTIAQVERGRLDPGVKRLHLLLRLYDVPVRVTADLLDLERLAEGLPEGRSITTLREEGLRHWKAGDIRNGLSHVFALRAQTPADKAAQLDRQQALLDFAIMAGALGKYRLSREIVQDLLVEPPATELRAKVLVQTAICWFWLGSADAAFGFLDRAEASVTGEEHEVLAFVLHTRASILVSMRAFREAGKALDRALAAYRKAGSPYGESQALAVRVRLCFESGDLKEALAAARVARKHASTHGYKRLELLRSIDEGRTLVALDKLPEGLAALNEALAAAIVSQDPLGRFYAHYFLWKGHTASGDSRSADFELQSAKHYVRGIDLAIPEADEIRSLDQPTQSRRRRKSIEADPA